MPKKTRGKFSQTEGWYFLAWGNTPWQFNCYSSYEVIDSNDVKHASYGNVYHTRRVMMEGRSVEVDSVGTSYPAWVGASHNFDNVGSSPEQEVQRWIPAFDREQFYARAFDDLKRSQMGTEINVLAQLFELRESLDMFAEWKKEVAKGIPSLVRKVKEIAAQPKSKTAASMHLLWSFGIAPLISLLKEGREAVTLALENSKKVVEFGKQLQTYHYSEVVQVAGGTTRLYGKDWRGFYCDAQVVPFEVRYTLTMQYRLDVKPFIVMGKDLTLYLLLFDRLGFSSWSAVWWNSLTMSFVFEWFSNLGKVLTQFDHPFSDINYKIEDACFSLKWDAYELLWTESNGMAKSAACSYAISQYSRERCIPTAGVVLPRWENKYGWSQFGLSASLIRTVVMK